MKKIYSDNVELIESKLDEVQGKCTARKLKSCDLNSTLSIIHRDRLNSIPKKYLKDTTIILHATMMKMPQSYKYPATETSCTFTHDGKGWVFVKCDRDFIKPSSKGCYNAEVKLSDTAKQAFLDSIAIV